MLKKVLKKNDKDQVATALEVIDIGDEVMVLSQDNVEIDRLKATDPVPFGNKVAVKVIDKGAPVFKGGDPIGRATKSISKGELVHVHNVESEKVNFPPAIIKEIIRQMELKEKGMQI